MTPWEQYPDIWPTKANYMSFIRGGIRNGLWKKHPVKMMALANACELVVNTNPRSMKRYPKVKRYRCAMCGKLFSQNDVSVDHIIGNHPLQEISDIQSFIEEIVVKASVDKLQVLCKNCHDIKTLAEKDGTSLDTARRKKQLLGLKKEHKGVKNLVVFLVSQGYNASMLKSEAARQSALEELVGLK